MPTKSITVQCVDGRCGTTDKKGKIRRGENRWRESVFLDICGQRDVYGRSRGEDE